MYIHTYIYIGKFSSVPDLVGDYVHIEMLVEFSIVDVSVNTYSVGIV